MVLGVEAIELQTKLRDGRNSIADCRKTNHAAVSLIFLLAVDFSSGMVETSGHEGPTNSFGCSDGCVERRVIDRSRVEVIWGNGKRELAWVLSMPAAS